MGGGVVGNGVVVAPAVVLSVVPAVVGLVEGGVVAGGAGVVISIRVPFSTYPNRPDV